VRANIKQLKASRLAPSLDVAEAIRAFEEMARGSSSAFKLIFEQKNACTGRRTPDSLTLMVISLFFGQRPEV